MIISAWPRLLVDKGCWLKEKKRRIMDDPDQEVRSHSANAVDTSGAGDDDWLFSLIMFVMLKPLGAVSLLLSVSRKACNHLIRVLTI